MNKENNEGLTPKDIAKNNKHEECVKLIVQTLDPEGTLNEDEDKGLTPSQDKQSVSMEVQAQIEWEENTDTLPIENNWQNDTESSVGEEKEPTVAPPPKKKKERKVSFLLEDETADKEPENDNHKFPDNVLEDGENEEGDRRVSTEIENSEPTVSICIYPKANLCYRLPQCHHLPTLS